MKIEDNIVIGHGLNMNYGFYIYVQTDNYYDEENVYKLFGINKKMYNDFMRKNCNAVFSSDEIPFFRKYRDLNKAIDWLESMILMQTLVGEEKDFNFTTHPSDRNAKII